MRLRPMMPLVAATLFLLAGCGVAVKEPPLPLEQPLLPATVYVPDCPREGGVLGFMGAMDRAPGLATCEAMHAALLVELSKTSAKVNLVDYKTVEGAEEFALQPDKAAEAAIGSKYRIVLMPAVSGRADSGYMSYTLTTMRLGVFATEGDKEIGDAKLYQEGGGPTIAVALAGVIAKGMVGPRCEVLNKFSLRTATHKGPQCASFVLQPL